MVLECNVYLHSEKDFLQVTCKVFHLSNFALQPIPGGDDLILKTTESHT